jgi:protein-S-isoprenylcysteine O-methyltransferase Ste14
LPKNRAETPKLTRSGYRRIVTVYLAVLFNGLLFFAAAGRLDLPRAWFYFLGLTLVQTFIFILMAVRFPEMAEVVNARGNIKMPKLWDKLFTLGYIIFTLFLLPLVAGFDVGRYRWSELGISWLVLGTVLLLVAMFLADWALIENKFFEAGVRVQTDRGQKVVSTGPYAIVRHPGYIAFIMLYSSLPLIVGSFYAFFVSLATALLFIIRTALEDATLQKELAGYVAYAKKTRYRLIPLIW